MCAAVPSPDQQRLTAARAQLSTAIAASRREEDGRATRRPRLAISLALRRRWLGWAAPLAAAAAVTGVILGSQGVFSPVHRPVPSSSTHDPGLGLAHPATAYVAGQSGTVTPIRTATSTALAPIRVPAGSFSMAITPDGRTIYVLDLGSSQAQEGMVIPIRTATNTALAPIRLADGAGPITITPDGRTAYVVAGSGPGRRGTVIPIRTATNQVLRAIAVGNLPSVIAITPAPRR